MTQWNNFINLLAQKKKSGTLNRLDVGGIIALIYAGAFDEAAGVTRATFAVYRDMAGELIKATKSQAKPPRATKSDLVGLDQAIEANDPTLLAVWRWQVNPLAKTNLLPLFTELLQINKFVPYQMSHKFFKMVRETPAGVCFLTTEWNGLFEDQATKRTVVDPKHITVALPGIITSRAERVYGADKKNMAVVSFYTGEDTAKDLVLWPAYGETDFSRAKYESMAPLNRGVLIVKPTLWNGKAGGRIEAFIRDFSQLRPVYEETKTTETAQVQETQGENREAI